MPYRMTTYVELRVNGIYLLHVARPPEFRMLAERGVPAWAATLKLNECRISRRVREAADDHLWVNATGKMAAALD